MREQLENPWRGRGLAGLAPLPIAAAEGVGRLLGLCPLSSTEMAMEGKELVRNEVEVVPWSKGTMAPISVALLQVLPWLVDFANRIAWPSLLVSNLRHTA